MKFSVRNYTRIAQAALTRSIPVYAHFGITHRCNLTCKMCGIWRYGNRKEELELDQIKQMAERMARLGVVQLSIGGGEPFAVSYLEEATRIFVENGLNTRVLTNGIGDGNGRNVVAGKRYIDVTVSDISLFRYPGERMILAEFTLDYHSDNFDFAAKKEQYWRQDGEGQWRIFREENR